jgi:hypothetical protein
MTTHAPSDAAPTPGRYVPANPGAVSRILKKAGLPRCSRGKRMGYSVSGNEVTLSTGYFNVFTEPLDEMASVASVALRGAGYLIFPATSDGSIVRHIDVFQPIRTDVHAREFLSRAYRCKIVTSDGAVIDALDDPKVKAEVAALERANQEREDAAKRARKLARDRQRAIVDRLKSLGIVAVPAAFGDPTKITTTVDELERLLGLLDGSTSEVDQ